MNHFKEYLLSKYQRKNAKTIKLSFCHNQSIRKDKGVPRINDIITVRIKLVDENLDTILSTSITFEKNMIPKEKEKSLINISPKELNNRFATAKQEICQAIKVEYMAKIDDFHKEKNMIK